MKTGCIGKSNTNNLPAPTDLTKNPYEKKILFFKSATQKSVSVVQWGIASEFVPRRPIFEKCPRLREKGGVLTKIWNSRNRLSRTVGCILGGLRFRSTVIRFFKFVWCFRQQVFHKFFLRNGSN
jgi:hypothetical protein